MLVDCVVIMFDGDVSRWLMDVVVVVVDVDDASTFGLMM